MLMACLKSLRFRHEPHRILRRYCPKSAKKDDKQVVRWHTKRPDLDNIEKSITDALCDLMEDDSQICMKRSCKVIAKFGEPEGIWVCLHTLHPWTGL